MYVVSNRCGFFSARLWFMASSLCFFPPD